MTEIYFIRHCESNHKNKDDFKRELTARGLNDGKLVTAFLKDKGINKIISSPYLRTIQTIKDFSDYSGLAIETRYELREWECYRWVDNFKEFIKPKWSDFDNVEDCESLNSVQKRNIQELKKILKEYEGQTIAIATHGMALSMIINYYDNSYGLGEFMAMVNKTPWAVKMVFDKDKCLSIEKIDLV